MRRVSSTHRPEKHDTGVVDQDICAPELLLYALGRGDDRRTVRDVGLERDLGVWIKGSVGALLSRPTLKAASPDSERY
jgi:hypothetical protein